MRVERRYDPAPFPVKEPDGFVFLGETGTPDYLRRKLPEYLATMARGKKASYPVVFGVAGVLFRRADYVRFDHDFRRLKVRHLGVDVPMSDHNVRTHRTPPFDVLRDQHRFAVFYADLASLFRAYDFGIVVCAIHKPDMEQAHAAPLHPYHYALETIVERTAMESKPYARYARRWQVVARDRDAGVNKILRREMFRLQQDGCAAVAPRVRVAASEVQQMFDTEVRFRANAENDTGLQVADLAVGPIVRFIYGLHEWRTLRLIVLPKVVRARNGKMPGFGLHCYPRFPPHREL